MTNNSGYGQPQYGWNTQQPMDQSPRPSNGAGNLPPYQPYPPPHADEQRIMAAIERIERKLDALSALIQAGRLR